QAELRQLLQAADHLAEVGCIAEVEKAVLVVLGDVRPLHPEQRRLLLVAPGVAVGDDAELPIVAFEGVDVPAWDPEEPPVLVHEGLVELLRAAEVEQPDPALLEEEIIP